MPRTPKKEDRPAPQKSHYEEQWTMSDYRDHEGEFRKMLEYHKAIQEKATGSVTMERWLWLERMGAVTLVEYMGQPDPRVVHPSSFQMYSAKYDRFREWMAFNEVKVAPKVDMVSPEEAESLEKMASGVADKMKV